MPQPMPPQGAPPQSQPSPAGSGAPSPDQGSGGGGAISTLLVNVDRAIDHLNLVIGQSKATDPEEKQMIQQIDQLYGQLMDRLGVGAPGGEGDSDGDEQSGPGAQGQTVPPEAGGNKGAIPAP